MSRCHNRVVCLEGAGRLKSSCKGRAAARRWWNEGMPAARGGSIRSVETTWRQHPTGTKNKKRQDMPRQSEHLKPRNRVIGHVDVALRKRSLELLYNKVVVASPYYVQQVRPHTRRVLSFQRKKISGKKHLRGDLFVRSTSQRHSCRLKLFWHSRASKRC